MWVKALNGALVNLNQTFAVTLAARTQYMFTDDAKKLGVELKSPRNVRMGWFVRAGSPGTRSYGDENAEPDDICLCWFEGVEGTEDDAKAKAMAQRVVDMIFQHIGGGNTFNLQALQREHQDAPEHLCDFTGWDETYFMLNAQP